MNIMLKKIIILFFSFSIILIFTGCRSEGKTDLPLFIEKFNKNYGEEKIAEDNMLIHDNTFYFFLPADSSENSEVLFTLTESDDKEICECGISVIKDVEINTDEFKAIFTSAFCSMTGEDKNKAFEIFDSLSLDDKDTYTKNKNVIKEVNKYKVDLISNDAGTGVYIYKASE